MLRGQSWWSSYMGDGDQEDHSSRPAKTKIYETPISTNKSGVEIHIYNLSYSGGIDGRIII
jgi:hypothetical protein